MEWMQLLGGGGIVAALSVLGTWYIGRGSNRNQAEQVEAERVKATLAGNFELTKYINEQIAAAKAEMKAEMKAEFDAQLNSLRAELKSVVERERGYQTIIRRFFQRLFWWNERGRIGEMPMPSDEDMHFLGLSDIEMTSPPEEIRRLRTPYVPPIPGRKETE